MIENGGKYYKCLECRGYPARIVEKHCGLRIELEWNGLFYVEAKRDGEITRECPFCGSTLVDTRKEGQDAKIEGNSDIIIGTSEQAQNKGQGAGDVKNNDGDDGKLPSSFS